MRGSVEARLAKVEHRLRHRIRGIHRYTDDELQGLIAILRQAEDGEALDPTREEWAAELLQREGLIT